LFDADRWTDGQTDMTKPVAAFRNFANAADEVGTVRWFCVEVQRVLSDSVPAPGVNYTGPREILLEFVILVF